MQDTKLTIIATISGFEYRNLIESSFTRDGKEYDRLVFDENNKPIKDLSSVEIQSCFYDNSEQILKLKKLTLNTPTTLEQMNKLIGKTFKFSNVVEKNINGEIIYFVSELGEEVQSEDSVFEIYKPQKKLGRKRNQSKKQTKRIQIYYTKEQIEILNEKNITNKQMSLFIKEVLSKYFNDPRLKK